MNKGLAYALGSYAIWGLLPIYWKILHQVPPSEILAHRVFWACLVTLGLLLWQKQGRALGVALRQPRVVVTFTSSAVLLSLNWFVYIWAVNDGHVVETSLGYFINPLVNVFLGMLFLRERLRLGQGLAVVIALCGVIYLTITAGAPPWISLFLAGSFGVYGLLRKTASLDSLVGLAFETALIAPFALAFLIYQEVTIGGAFVHQSLSTDLLLASSGIVTAAPLLMFASGARKLSLTTMGIAQYIAPTLQFLIGIFLYHEPLTPHRLAGFGLIWLALAIYTVEGLTRNKRLQSQPASA